MNTRLHHLVDVRDWLASKSHEKVLLHDLADYAGYSPYHLQRIFTETFGESPAEFHAKLRHLRAKELLLHTDHSIDEIAWETGYESVSSFIRKFKLQVGLTPTQFRKQAKNCFHVSQWLTPRFIPMCLAPACTGISATSDNN